MAETTGKASGGRRGFGGVARPEDEAIKRARGIFYGEALGGLWDSYMGDGAVEAARYMIDVLMSSQDWSKQVTDPRDMSLLTDWLMHSGRLWREMGGIGEDVLGYRTASALTGLSERRAKRLLTLSRVIGTVIVDPVPGEGVGGVEGVEGLSGVRGNTSRNGSCGEGTNEGSVGANGGVTGEKREAQKKMKRSDGATVGSAGKGKAGVDGAVRSVIPAATGTGPTTAPVAPSARASSGGEGCPSVLRGNEVRGVGVGGERGDRHQRVEARRLEGVDRRDAWRWRRLEDELEVAVGAALARVTNNGAVRRDGLRREEGLSEYVQNRLDGLRREVGGYALVVAPQDFHWGGYAWEDETGERYNREEARDRIERYTAQVLALLPAHAAPEVIYVSAGGDWFHVDGDHAMTTRGTPMEPDGSPTEVFMTGCEMAELQIERLAEVAPVEVVPMPGNHDRSNSFALMMYLAARYKGSRRVKVHVSARIRQYLRYRNTLMGFTHGDKVKAQHLGQVMATEARELWGQTTEHVWFTGHLHHEVVREVGGIVQYQLPSLAGTDRWHARSGFVTARAGLCGHLIGEGGVFQSIFAKVRAR